MVEYPLESNRLRAVFEHDLTGTSNSLVLKTLEGRGPTVGRATRPASGLVGRGKSSHQMSSFSRRARSRATVVARVQ